MPTVVGYALYYVLDMAVLSALGTVGVTLLSYAIVMGAYYAYGSYQAKAARDAARSSFNSTLKDRLVMTATTDAPRSRIYGRCRNVDGIVYKATHGDKEQFYTFVIALAGHEIDAVEDVWFAYQKVTLDGSGYVLTAPYAQLAQRTETAAGTLTNGAGSITLAHPPVAGSVAVLQTLGQNLDVINISLAVTVSGSTISYSGGDPAYDTVGVTASYQWAESSQNARVRSFLGSAGQDLSGALIALGISGITAAHKFQGMACLLVTLTYSIEAFPQGVPNFSATMRGARVFDPRTSTTAWTRNPALIARDWSTYQYGGGALASEIDDTILIASANACDVSVTFQTTPPITEATYYADLVAPTLTDPTSTLNEIVSAMAGKYAWCGGRLRIRAGAYSVPVAAIDESWASGAGSIEITAGVARIDLVNIYRPSIADASKGYVVAPTVPVRAQPYITADGQELPRDLTLFAVTDYYHAQHVCGAMLRDSRQALTIKMPCNMKAYPVEVFDVVSVTLPFYGWAAKLFEVVSWNYSPTGGVVLTMKETAAAIWTPAIAFAAQDEAPNTNLPLPWLVPQATGLTIASGTAALVDGSIVTRVLATWDATTSESVRQSGHVELQYWPLADALPAGDWLSDVSEGSATRTVLSGLLTNRAYVFRVRQVNSIGVRDAWSTQAVHVVARPPGSFDTTFTARVGCVVAGNTGSKATGVAATWDSDIYTREGAYGACFASAVVASLDGRVMFGLNTDPLTDSNYSSIDFAWYVEGRPGAQQLSIYESGTQKQSSGGAYIIGPVVSGDVLAVYYDGANVRYTINGVVKRTVATTSGQTLYFDSSFYDVGATLRSMRFGLLSDIAPALAAAAAAQATANSAATDASSAIVQLSAIASDAVLAKNEKSAVIVDWAAIANERAGIMANAATYNVTTDATNYNAAVDTLAAYLNALSPTAGGLIAPWNDVTTNTPIDGPTFRARFGDVYRLRQVVLADIAVVAGQRAVWSGVSGVAVTTSQIHADAVTSVFSNADAGPHSVAQTASQLNTPYVTFTPDVDCKISVTIVAAGFKNDTSKGAMFPYCSNATTTTVNAGELIVSSTPLLAVSRAVFTVPAGVATTVGMRLVCATSVGSGATVTDIHFTAEFIKR